MAWRKWLVRFLVFSTMGGLAAAGLLYERYTDPVEVRRQVLAQLETQFPGARFVVDSARLSLLGGIALSDVHLVRRDDPAQNDVLAVPSATIYPDKEQAIEGRLVIRKVLLQRPRFRIIRGANGVWNVAGILGPQNLKEYKPTLVIEHGVIVFEDQMAGAKTPLIELTDVHLELLNDPLPQCKFEVRAQCAILGPLEFQGVWQRATNGTALTVRAPAIAIGETLLRRLAVFEPALAEQAPYIQGKAALTAALRYDSEANPAWQHEIRLDLREGRLTCPKAPLALDHLEVTAVCRDGQVTLEKVTARSGAARVAFRMELLPRTAGTPTPSNPTDCIKKLDLHIDELAVDDRLFERLPKLKKINERFSPVGTTEVTYQIERDGTRWRKHCVLVPHDVTACYDKFRYELRGVKGRIEHEERSDGFERVQLDLIGYAGRQPITIHGQVDGDGETAGIDLTIKGENIPLDAKLQAALSAENQKLARSFAPTGLGDLDVRVQRKLGEREMQNHYTITFHDATARYNIFPYPLERVSGVLAIHPDWWEFRDFTGSHNGCQIRTWGRSNQGPRKDQLLVYIQGEGLPLDDQLKAAIVMPELKQVWKTFSPSGKMDFNAQVVSRKGHSPDVNVTVRPRDAAIRPSFFPIALTNVNGVIWYTPERWVILEKLQGRHQDTVLSLDQGWFYCKPQGGLYGKMVGLRGDPILPQADIIEALPPPLRKVFTTLQIRDPLVLQKSDLEIDVPAQSERAPTIKWDGAVALKNAHVQTGVPFEGVSGRVACRGRFDGQQLEGVVGNLGIDEATLYGQPLRNLQGQIEVQKPEPNVLRGQGVKAEFFGGEIYGDLRVDLGPPLNYNVKLTASQVDLKEFARQNLQGRTDINGLATASLYLEGKGESLDGLQGRGHIDVPNGHLYNLPLLVNLLKVLKLQFPDKTAFEEAYAAFSIRGPRINVERLDLFGSLISLGGKGEIDLDAGRFGLDFYSVPGRVVQMLPPVLGKIPPAISKQLWKTKMSGRIEKGQIQDLHIVPEMAPIVFDPLGKLFERMK